MADLKVGQTVETTAGNKGIIRYIGEIAISKGQFIGLELPDASGKNDGSISTGQRYFSVKPFHGLFVRPGSIERVIAQPQPPKPAQPKPAAAAKPKAAPPRTSLRPTSLTGPPRQAPKTTNPANRLSIAPPSLQAASKAPSKRLSIAASSTSSASSSSRGLGGLSKPTTRPAPTSSTSSATSKPNIQQKAKSAQDSELETKLKHLEKQHEDDKTLLQTLEKAKDDRDRFESIIQKLQTKCQNFHSEITSLKSQLKDSETELDRLSRHEAESESILELATLDREMAEERAEQAEAELDSLKQKLDEQALELEILSSERELLTEDMSEEEKQAAGYYRLQSENTRLKEALFRLKELTEETEDDLRLRIEELEQDAAQTDTLREERNSLRLQVANNDTTIEDLRQQIDAANDWEDIIEDLSEQNQQIKDKLAERDIAIRDLENLKELNDELELHHIEQANDLRAELEARDVELAQHSQRVSEQDAALLEQEQLIEKFRDLVLDLQSKMTDAESSKTMSEEQARDVSDRFNEVMELNRRLRTANVNALNKTIVSELQVLKAEEAEEELAIFGHFLPNSSEIQSNNSLRAYFCAKRISFKATLASALITKAPIPVDSTEEADIVHYKVSRAHTLRYLTNLRLNADLFWSAVSSADLEQFDAFGRGHAELIPVEKAVDRCLDALKQDELNFDDLSGFIRGAKNIIEGVNADFRDVLSNRPEDEIYCRVSSLKSRFEFLKATFDAVAIYLAITQVDEDETDDLDELVRQLKGFSNQSEGSILAADKLAHTLETLRVDGLYPRYPGGLEEFAQQEDVLDRTLEAAESFVYKIVSFLVAAKNNSAELSITIISEQFNTYKDLHFNEGESSRIQDIGSMLKSWNEFASVLMNNVEIDHGPAPWELKAAQIQASKKQTGEAEKQLQLLTQEHQMSMLQIRERDEIIETKELENEHLKAKTRDAFAKVQELQRMEADLERTRREYEHFRQEVGKQIEELKRAEARKQQSQQPEATQSAPQPRVASDAGQDRSKSTNVSSTFVQYADALSSENNWLRRRKNSEVLGRNMEDMFSGMATRKLQVAHAKSEARRKQAKLDDTSSMILNMEKSEMVTPARATTPAHLQTLQTPGSKIPSSCIVSSTPIHFFDRPPIVLGSLNTSFASPSYSEEDLGNLEDLSFIDLSPISEEFSLEMTEALEGFSEFRQLTLQNIVAQS